MGPDKKFKEKVLPLTDKLFRLAFSIAGNRQDAEDVVQDAMLKIWQKREEWGNITNLEGYCLRSVRNIALDKIALKENQLEQIPKHFEIQAPNSVDTEKIEEEQMEMILKVVSSLPEKQQMVFQLRDIEGMSYKDIEGIMNISEDQVKVNLFRARQKIKLYFKV